MRRKSAEFLSEGAGSVQLVLTSPPDLSEARVANWDELFSLYSCVFAKCVPILSDRGALVVIVTDRKHKGTIVWKHEQIRSILEQNRMVLFAHKILVRTPKVDLFRVGFSHLMCFRKRKGATAARPLSADVWGPFPRPPGLAWRRNGFPAGAVKLLVESFTRRGDLVLDPFCGAGTTQRVALGLSRASIGYEIDPSLHSYWDAIRTANADEAVSI